MKKNFMIKTRLLMQFLPLLSAVYNALFNCKNRSISLTYTQVFDSIATTLIKNFFFI